ncbi:MAG: C40 family peptidase [Synechococcales cyanobacterium CRU_2_2]|nr:C40 family peptidase [Synechococcales cyanobacterium CRU_2_2]
MIDPAKPTTAAPADSPLADFLVRADRHHIQWRVLAPLNVYDSPQCERLATQADGDRHLHLRSDLHPEYPALAVELVEDQYPGWILLTDLPLLAPAAVDYVGVELARAAIASKLPTIIAFMEAAMQTPNQYRWGGTVAPDYDCSGLMQAAFRSQGIWLPRDAYQQEVFVAEIVAPIEGDRINCQALQPGDLVFFGTPQKATHVGLYLSEDRYIHSSGKDIGRNGIAIDQLRGDDQAHPISQAYFRQFRGAGRVIASYRNIP